MSDDIRRIMSQIFGIPEEDITDDSSPTSIERWDSLKHMQLVMALEDDLGIQFPDEVIPELVSVAAIKTAVAELSEARS